MQSIFHGIKTALEGNIVLAIGYILLGILLAQGCSLLYLTLKRIYFQREYQRLERQRL